MDKKGGFTVGLLLILVGLFVLVAQFTGWQISWGNLWPFILILIGIMMLLRIDKEKGVIFPSIILIGIGLIFVASESQIFGAGVDLGMLWPLFIIVPGLGFVGLWVTDTKNWGVLVPAAACLITGTIFLTMRFAENAHWIGYMMPAIIIIIGIVVLMGGFFKKKDDNSNNNINK